LWLANEFVFVLLRIWRIIMYLTYFILFVLAQWTLALGLLLIIVSYMMFSILITTCAVL